MTMIVIGFAATSAKATLIPYNFVWRNLSDDDVVIEILYCGICHTYIYYVQNDWWGSTFPLAPGQI